MSHRTVVRYIVLLALIGVMGASPLSADTVIHTYDSSAGGTLLVGDSGSFTLPQYSDPDPLIFVTIEVTAHTTGGYFTFDNESDIPGTPTVSMQSWIDITSDTPAAPLVLLVIPEASLQQAVTADEVGEAGTPGTWLGQPVNADYAGPDSITITGDGLSDSGLDELSSVTDDLSPFIGNGTVTWTFGSRLGANADSNLPLAQTQQFAPEFSFTAKVIYTNTAIPEPAAAALLCVGLATLRRRRRARN